jgi:hypothetical protein
MRWCGGVTRAAVSNWFTRWPGEVPQPDVVIVNEGSDQVTRGWLPGRREEWEKFAAARKANPAGSAASAARRARSTAELIAQGVDAGTIDPHEGVRLLQELIGRPGATGQEGTA